MTYKEKIEEATGLEMTIKGNGVGRIYLGGRLLYEDCVDGWFDCTQGCDVNCKECWNNECESKIILTLEESFFMDGVIK